MYPCLSNHGLVKECLPDYTLDQSTAPKGQRSALKLRWLRELRKRRVKSGCKRAGSAAGEGRAGGRARRLGGVKKALLAVGGQPIIERIRTRLAGLYDELLIADVDAQLAGLLGARVVPDVEPGGGPLAALAGALAAATGDWALVVAADMPFVAPALFRALHTAALATHAEAAVPRVGGRPEP
ncbi:MAG: NTP transferase domain-containing protein, partial [Alicyclobacillus sp.]|nr:NTP transferase domain-containing protein [Alicyclobacillus sp.]